MATRLAIAQLVAPLCREPAAAREEAIAAAERAFGAGANVVVLPELVVPGYTTDPDVLRRVAETVPGPTTDAATESARAAGGVVVLGLAERVEDQVFNTAVAVSADGVIARYRKLHLFDAEKHTFAPGDLGLPVVTTPFGRLGLCICYDLRFPEVARILALRGAEIVCAPAAWVAGFDHAPAEVPGQVQGAVVQANLNQVFLACASQVGHPDQHRFLGSSVLVGPFGELALGPLSREDEELAIADVDLDLCRQALQRSELVTPRADRRTDVYGILYDGEQL